MHPYFRLERERETDRQTDRQTDEQACRQTDRQTELLTTNYYVYLSFSYRNDYLNCFVNRRGPINLSHRHRKDLEPYIWQD